MEVEKDSQRLRQSSVKAPKLPPLQESNAYINWFEHYADARSWLKEEWATSFSTLLTGKALDVYYRMPSDKVNDYEDLKEALLGRF